MALDIALLGEDGEPEIAVAVNIDVHQRLVRLSDAMGLPLIQRLSDYYEDAEFDAADMPELKDELDRAAANTTDRELADLVSAIKELANRAHGTRRGLVAVAD